MGQRTTDLSVSNEQLRLEIHEREQAETRLEQQRAFLRQIIDTIPNYVFVKDANGRYLMANKAMADAYKTTPTSLEGRTLGEFNPNQQEVARFEQGDHQVLATQEEVFWPELSFTDLDGNKHWLQLVKRPLFDPTTGATNVLGISTDITLEKTVTESLREKEENFRTLVEASFEGIIICVNHIVQEANISFAHMFGYTAVANVIGKNAKEFLASDDIETLQAQLMGHPKTIMEAVGIRQDHTTFPLELVTHTINFQGQVAQITGYRDITTRKQAEEAEQHARKLESLSLMAGGLAHDFNNLLVAMMGQMAIAKAKIEPTHSSQNNLDKAIQATETAALLTRQLLAYTGQGHFEVTTINLNQLIAQNLRLFQDALPPNITFQTNLHDPLPQMQADGVQIQQIIMNLLLNAAEALGTQPGTITINTTPCQLKANQLAQWQQHNEAITPGEFVLLEVSDTGRGMDEATLNRIFDPFFSTKGTGRGLGLAAVMGIVRGHHGSVRASSRLGQGSTFQFLFPSEMADSVAVETAVPQRTPQQNTVLIIDDERQVREAMRDILDLQEIPTLTAASGQEGIDQFTVHQAKIGLIILDLSMPGMSGIEAFSGLRSIDPTIKIILSSGYTETEILEKMAGTRPTGFLQKPYRLEKVLNTVTQFLT
ncbi:MAG: PAS domain S-box protein [Chloroflexota bacterium]